MLSTLKNKVLDGLRTLSDRHSPMSETLLVDLIKSESDYKEYRIIQLKNGLRAILISDSAETNDSKVVTDKKEDYTSESDESDSGSLGESNSHSESEENEESSVPRKETKEISACALCVGVGTFSDPPSIPGLAHMLEHTVFMGSEKYPGVSSFDSFIKRHGGNNNGETDSERTVFYFECSETSLKDAMDRFAQFFISPLLSKEALISERENVQSEFDDCLLSNSTRKYQVFSCLAPDGHPAKKFSWGNLKTLKDDVDIDTLYNAVHEFRRRHYSAHRMTMAVQARLDLDSLEKYIVDTFSDVPNNNLPPDDFTPYRNTFGFSGDINNILWVKPIKKMNQVEITWVLPSYLHEYRSRPIGYVSWMIDQESDGSLSSYLTKKTWALECETAKDDYGFNNNSIYSLFTIYIKLTEEGYKHIKEVIAALFSYLKMFRDLGPNKAVFDELEFIARNSFRFKKEMHSSDYAHALSEAMQLYEPSDIIAGDNLYLEYKPELYAEILNLLTPGRANILIMNDKKDDTFYDKLESWFGTKYKVEEIPEDWVQAWENCKPIEEFRLPDPNPYISTNFELLEKPLITYPFPKKIIDDGMLEIWHQQDVKFNRPIACYYFFFMSRMSWPNTMNTILLDVLLNYYDKKFVGKTYAANEASLFYEFYRSKFGITLTLTGYNEKLPLLFEEVCNLMNKHLRELKTEENRVLLSAIVKNMTLSYYNKLLKPDQFLDVLRYTLITDSTWSSLDYLQGLPDVTADKLYDFGMEFFSKSCILGLIQGNVAESEVPKLCANFKTYINIAPIEKFQPVLPVVKLPPGETCLKFKSFNSKASNSIIMNYYQFGHKSLRDGCIIDLLMMIMDDSLFNNLRTKQKVGYTVTCEPRDIYGILGFSISISFQSSKFDSEDVDSRIETFLANFDDTLKSVGEEEFTEIKKGLCYMKYSVELDLYNEVTASFDEICSREFMFDRYQQEAAIIRGLQLEDLCQWYEDNILSPENYKKLSIQIVGPTEPSDSTEDSGTFISDLNLLVLPGVGPKKDNYVTDVTEFKNKREFYPIKKLV